MYPYNNYQRICAGVLQLNVYALCVIVAILLVHVLIVYAILSGKFTIGLHI